MIKVSDSIMYATLNALVKDAAEHDDVDIVKSAVFLMNYFLENKANFMILKTFDNVVDEFRTNNLDD